jgi:uncharacterized protein (DUF885 family)
MVRPSPERTAAMKPTLLTVALLAALCAGCNEQATAPAPADAPVAASAPSAADATKAADTAFAELSKRALDGYMKISPVGATQIGDHRYDSEVDDLSATGRAATIAYDREMLAALDAIHVAALSRENQIDAAILRNQLQYDLWNQETLQSWAWDPQVYGQLAGGAIYTLMAREFAPRPERMKSAVARIEKIPAIYRQMRENLDPKRVPKIHAETVAKQNAGVVSLVDQFIVPHLDELQGADRERADAAIAALRTAVAEQQKWLDETLVPNAAGDFRIGAALYDRKLAFALNSPLTSAEIRQRADAEVKRVREEMYAIARTVLAGKDGAPPLPEQPSADEQQAGIEAVLELAYADRPARADVVETAKSSTAEATEFVRAKNLVELPDAPVQIILMPEFQRGVSVAYCDSPGPLDKQLDTFYAVSPIPDDWTEEQTTSFLREYNRRSIHELSIHEAMPGHYLQLFHSNRHPSVLRAVLSSGPFVEGWAVYAEKVMIDAGYMANDPLMKLINLKWYLRVLTNAIMDQAIHVEGMTREQAMELMTKTGFQQEREAAGKWVRAQLTSAQLPVYFVGFQEHLDLRREMEQKLGAKFDLRAYHDTVLSYGSPPVRYVRAQLLELPIQ